MILFAPHALTTAIVLIISLKLPLFSKYHSQQTDRTGSKNYDRAGRSEFWRIPNGVDSDAQGLHHCTLFKGEIVRQLVATVLISCVMSGAYNSQISWERVVALQSSIKAFRRCEFHCAAVII